MKKILIIFFALCVGTLYAQEVPDSVATKNKWVKVQEKSIGKIKFCEVDKIINLNQETLVATCGVKYYDKYGNLIVNGTIQVDLNSAINSITLKQLLKQATKGKHSLVED